MSSLLSLFFLGYAAYLTLAERVVERYKKGLYRDGPKISVNQAKIFARPGRLTLTIWISNLFCYLAFFACLMLSRNHQPFLFNPVVDGFLLSFVFLLFLGKLFPRIYAARFPSSSLKGVAFTLRVFLMPFYLLGIPLLHISQKMTFVKGIQNDDEFFGSVTEDEILHFVEAGEKAGTIETHEREMIRSVIGLTDTVAREVMVPRTKIISIESGTSLKEALQIISRSGFTRLPVFQENIDHIKGVLYAKDLLSYFDSDPIRADLIPAIMHEPVFVPETKKVVELLSEFNRDRTHIAIVVDEYGGTAGLITVEDILEEIVGEIQDEYDLPQQPPILKVSENTYHVLGQTPTHEIRDTLKINIEEKEDFDSIAGFLTDAMGKIPDTGEIFHQDQVQFTILEADERRVLKVKIELTVSE